MSDPFRWPALAGGAALVGEVLHCELGPVPRDVPPDAAGEAGGDAASLHPNPRLRLASAGAATRPGLGYLYEFAERINLRRLDLSRLALDLVAPAAYPLLKPGEELAGQPLIGWIAALEGQCPAAVDAAEWAFKIDQLRAAALFLLPHPQTLDLVGLPRDPRVPALLAVLAADPRAVGDHLAALGEPVLSRLLAHSTDCPDAALVTDIQTWVQQWEAAIGSAERGPVLRDLVHDFPAIA